MLGLNGRGQLVSTADDLDDPVGSRVVEDLSRFETNFGFAAQCWGAWRPMERVCSDAGLSLANIVKTTIYLRNFEEAWIYEEIRDAFIPQRALPAVEFVAVSGPGSVPEAHVQIEAIAADDI
jgi:enamine deaminase RidA (YjgF/YER057c/UK114 family)